MYGLTDGYDYYDIPRAERRWQRELRREQKAEWLDNLREDVTSELACRYGAYDTLDDAESDRRWARAEAEAAEMELEDLLAVPL